VTRLRKLPEPTREEVLTWLGLTNKTPMEAVDHFWPGSGDEDRHRRCARVRKWAQRARDTAAGVRDAAPPLPPVPSLDASSIPRPELVPKPADEEEDRLTWLRRQLREAEQDLALARAEKRNKDIATFGARASKARDEYDQAMERERRIVRLARTPGAISAELARRADAIALRAELWRRRALKASKAEEGG
jgi:hypothetical protein